MMANAATGQCANFKPAWLIEAITELRPYIKLFTDKFRKRHTLPILPTKQAMLNLIHNNIADPKEPLRFEDLVEYLDELKMWGRQCVVLYTLKNDEGKYLADLRKPDFIENRLKANKSRVRLKKSICRWKSDTPFLSEVKHNFDAAEKRGELSFKWVQTREFEILIDRAYQKFKERSVNFFIVNLEDGSAQLRIQSLPDLSLTTLGKELQTYTEEIEELIEFDRFSPVSLKPVMKEFLFKRVLPVTSWRVETRIGNMNGDGDPFFLWRRFILPFLGITPREIRVYWKCEQDIGNRNRGKLHFALEAEDDVDIDVIIFNAITDESKVNYLVSNILDTERLHFNGGNGGKPPPPEDSLRGKMKRKAAGTPHERLKNVLIEMSIVPGAGVIRGLFHIITEWLGETLVESVTNLPFIIFELLAYALWVFVFYGGDRIKAFISGKSIELIINNREYDKWLEAQTA